MGDTLTILIAARDEAERIGTTIEELRRRFPNAEVIVADDGSRDATADVAEAAGALVLRLPHRGKGQALTLGERVANQGELLLCDADLRGDLRPLLEGESDLTVAAFARRQGGGFGIAKQAARRLIRLASPYDAQEPLSGQRRLTQQARAEVFPLAAGFGCETAMTADAARAGLTISETPVDLEHRATGRDLRGFLHRGRQLRDILLAFGPQGRNHRGLRLPLVGWVVGLAQPSVLPVAAIGVADDLWSGEERGFRAHLGTGTTTGVLKLVGSPRTRSGGPGRCPERSSSASPRTCSTSSTRSPAGRSRPICWRRSRSARRRRQPSCSRPTIFERWRCSVTPDRMRSAPC